MAVVVAKDDGDRLRQLQPLRPPFWLGLDDLSHSIQYARVPDYLGDHGGAGTLSTRPSALSRYPSQSDDGLPHPSRCPTRLGINERNRDFHQPCCIGLPRVGKTPRSAFFMVALGERSSRAAREWSGPASPREIIARFALARTPGILGSEPAR